MGSNKTDPLAKEDELPEHRVRLPGFWIYTNEVNNDLYAQCVAAGKCSEPAKSDTGPKSHYGDPAFKEFPVVGVTWNQADAFCKFQDAHLPSEAEWEKTARGFFGNPFPWGPAEAACDLANINGCVKDTAKVGNYEAGKSPFEVRDLAGNVREWVNDWYKADEYKTAALYIPIGPDNGTLKVVRGGSYLDSARDVRSSARFAYDPEREFDDVGFRCVPNGETFSSFCSSTYRPNCRPPRPGDPPDQCNPGEITGNDIKAKVSLSCPNNGTGTIKVGTTDPVAGVSVSIDGGAANCSTEPGTLFTCTGPIPNAGTPVTVQVCLNYFTDAFNPDFGVHAVNCETFNLVTSIGDAIETAGTNLDPYFLSSLAFVPIQMKIDDNCPTGYTWDPKLGQCTKIPGIPGEVPPGTEGRCPEGYVLDPNLLCCVPGTLDNGGCEPGYYMAAAAQLCIPIEQNGCPIGYTYDPYLGCLKPVHQGDDIPGCPQGTHLANDGKTCEVDHQEGNLHITCPPGSSYVEGQGCATSTVGTPPVQCPENSTYDYNLKTCVGDKQDGCPAGTYLDPDLKQCLPLTGPWTGCAPNSMINPKTGCCVPVPGTDNTDCIGYPDGNGGPVLKIKTDDPGWDPGQSNCPPPVEMLCSPGYHSNQEGTMCLPNTECPPGTDKSPNNPNGCFPTNGGPCPGGYEMSNSGLGCVPIMQDGIAYQCAPSQYFDPVMGMCLDRTQDCCAQGYYFSDKEKICVPILQNGNYCPPGWIWDGAEGCTPAIQQGANCTDINLIVPPCIVTCDKGFEWNANKGACVKIVNCSNVNCPISTTCPSSCCRREPTGKCVKK